MNFGILTCSDRASAGVYEDRSGPAIRDYLETHVRSAFEIEARVVPDDQPTIETALRDLAERCYLIVTTGGTGPAPRDVTPEATEAVCDRMLPGFGELMRAVSLNSVPTAILSRQTAGLCGSCLIINVPGKPAAITDCLDAVFPAVPYCIHLAGGPLIDADNGFVPANLKVDSLNSPDSR